MPVAAHTPGLFHSYAFAWVSAAWLSQQHLQARAAADMGTTSSWDAKDELRAILFEAGLGRELPGLHRHAHVVAIPGQWLWTGQAAGSQTKATDY